MQRPILLKIYSEVFRIYRNPAAPQRARYLSHHTCNRRFLSQSRCQGPFRWLEDRGQSRTARSPGNGEGTAVSLSPGRWDSVFFRFDVRHQICTPELKNLRKHLVDAEHLKFI